MNVQDVMVRLSRYLQSPSIYEGYVLPSEHDLLAAINDKIDDETRGFMINYAGAQQWDRRTVTVEVLNEYPERWVLADFEAKIASAIADIPRDKRGAASVELCGGYDESTYLKISYDRDETDEEHAERIGNALMYARARQAAEKLAYERLRKKFG